MIRTLLNFSVVLIAGLMLISLASCNKTAENTNKPVQIDGWSFTVDNQSVSPAGTLQIAPGQVLTIKVNYTDPDAGEDPDPGDYTFMWATERVNGGTSSFNPNDNFIVSNENPMIWTAPQVTGFYRFICQVYDRYMTPCQENVVVEVNSNKPPVITTLNISDANPFVNIPIQIDIVATDPDGNIPLEYIWEANGGYFTWQQDGSAKWVCATSGTFQITVDVNDTAGGTTTRSIPINVQANHPPVIQGWTLDPEGSVAINGFVNITITSDDQDDDDLEYNWSPDKGTFSVVNKNVAMWRAPSTAGTYTVVCEVRDNKGGTDTASIAINVTN